MDRNQHHSIVSVQSTVPSSLRNSFDPSSTVPASSTRATPLRHHSNKKPSLPIPAAMARVKGMATMNSTSRLNSESSQFNDPSPLTGTPGVTSRNTKSRTGTPERKSTPLVNPTSALLQDLLREQRATRASQGPASDDCAENIPRTPGHSRSQSKSESQSRSRSQSLEDAMSEKQRQVHAALSAGLKQPHEMGIREMDQYVSKINKLNFDLKLDIFHRTQQMAAMEKKLERMQQLEEEVQRKRHLEEELQELRNAEEDNQRLRESNEQLWQEIDRRDQAVTEAVELICQLEDILEELEAGQSSRPSTARPPTSDGSDVATPKNRVKPDIPERSSSKKATMLIEQHQVSSESRSLTEAPLFLREEYQRTAALRSLYVSADNRSQSARSAMTKTESMNSMTETIEPESPRLSALSECSELMPDTFMEPPLFDRTNISVCQEIPTARYTATSGLDVGKQARRHVEGPSWHQSLLDSSPTANMEKRKEQGRATASKAANNSAFENGVFLTGNNHRMRLENVSGGSRIPPTLEIMSTACATVANRSSGSGTTEKVPLDNVSSVQRKLAQPRSVDESTARRGPVNSGMIPSMDINLNDVTVPRPSADGVEGTPALFPLNGIPAKTSYLPNQGSSRPSMGYRGIDDVTLNPWNFENIPGIEKEHCSPPDSLTKRPSADLTSPSPLLTHEDWIEAGKPDPDCGKKRPTETKRIRRHTVDLTVRDSAVPAVPAVPALALDTNPQPVNQKRGHRRRISLRPPFLSRLGQPRCLQPSLATNSEDSGDGAPSPVIRKTRHMGGPKPPKTTQSAGAPACGHGELCAAPTNTESSSANTDDALPHSDTDSSFWSRAPTVRPPTPASKGHKRRGSLGVFGWLKGGIGSHKKSAGESQPTSQTSSQERPTSRWAREIPDTVPEGAKGATCKCQLRV